MHTHTYPQCNGFVYSKLFHWVFDDLMHSDALTPTYLYKCPSCVCHSQTCTSLIFLITGKNTYSWLQSRLESSEWWAACLPEPVGSSNIQHCSQLSAQLSSGSTLSVAHLFALWSAGMNVLLEWTQPFVLGLTGWKCDSWDLAVPTSQCSAEMVKYLQKTYPLALFVSW